MRSAAAAKGGTEMRRKGKKTSEIMNCSLLSRKCTIRCHSFSLLSYEKCAELYIVRSRNLAQNGEMPLSLHVRKMSVSAVAAAAAINFPFGTRLNEFLRECARHLGTERWTTGDSYSGFGSCGIDKKEFGETQRCC